MKEIFLLAQILLSIALRRRRESESLTGQRVCSDENGSVHRGASLPQRCRHRGVDQAQRPRTALAYNGTVAPAIESAYETEEKDEGGGSKGGRDRTGQDRQKNAAGDSGGRTVRLEQKIKEMKKSRKRELFRLDGADPGRREE